MRGAKPAAALVGALLAGVVMSFGQTFAPDVLVGEALRLLPSLRDRAVAAAAAVGAALFLAYGG